MSNTPSTIILIDSGEYYELVDEMAKMRNNPYMWWVRHNDMKRMISVNFDISHELIADLTASGDNDLNIVVQKIVEDIRKEHAKYAKTQQ